MACERESNVVQTVRTVNASLLSGHSSSFPAGGWVCRFRARRFGGCLACSRVHGKLCKRVLFGVFERVAYPACCWFQQIASIAKFLKMSCRELSSGHKPKGKEPRRSKNPCPN